MIKPIIAVVLGLASASQAAALGNPGGSIILGYLGKSSVSLNLEGGGSDNYPVGSTNALSNRFSFEANRQNLTSRIDTEFSTVNTGSTRLYVGELKLADTLPQSIAGYQIQLGTGLSANFQ